MTNNIWQSFVPYHVAEALINDTDAPALGRASRFNAIALFADVSGFTAISEALAKSGKSGAEELTRILNDYFEPMIDLIEAYGGIVGKFGGDAMTVLFPYTAQDARTVALRALECALTMQADMDKYTRIPTSAGYFGLAMKAGLGCGEIFCTNVGNPAIRLEYIIAGKPLDDCADAEHHATKGEVVCHAALLELLPEVSPLETRGDFRLITSLPIRAFPAPRPPLPPPNPQATRHLQAFIHPALVERIQNRQIQFINEHRKVTVLFIRFDGLDYRTADAGMQFQDYLNRVIEIVARYDGYLNKVDMGDKGSKMIVLFGAPIAHEDDAARALHCALEIRDLPQASTRIGINSGFVFCGQVGSAVRQEYTVMGDAVNLAARLMQAAQTGEIVVSEATHTAAAAEFEWRDSRSIQVKGKSAPISIYSLVSAHRSSGMRLQEPQYSLPMVGRQAELEEIRTRLNRAMLGQGQIVGISAEAGMGKSRLAAEVIRLALQMGFQGFGGECVSHGTTTSYLVWRGVLRGLLDVDAQAPLETQIRQVRARLKAFDPDTLNRLPLLGLPLNLPIPENALTAAMDSRLRKESLESLLIAYIRWRASREPLLLVFEDTHWIDPLSNDLLEAIGRSISDLPVLLLVVYRPPESERIQPHITRLGHFTAIRLHEFTPEEAESLINLKLARLFGEELNIPDEFIRQINARAQGNPFYIDELVNLVRDRNLKPRDLQNLDQLDLPDSLSSLILSRIDRLTEEAKTTLKVASVIGRVFRASWLWQIYPQVGSPEQVRAQLAQLEALDITPMDKPEPELEYLFKHIVTREVAYESISVATRQQLHENAGKFIERTYPNDLAQMLDLLAYHYGASANRAKQIEYYRRAGEAAQKAYANEAAIGYYEKLLPLLEESQSKVEVLIDIGSIFRVVGRWTEAEIYLEQAAHLAKKIGLDLLLAKSLLFLGSTQAAKSSYDLAEMNLTAALQIFKQHNNYLGIQDAFSNIGVIQWAKGDLDNALENILKSREIANNQQNALGLAQASGNLGLIYETKGDYKNALTFYEECAEISEQNANKLYLSKILGNIGNIYLNLGDYQKSISYQFQALSLALEIGNRPSAVITIGNIGYIYMLHGDYQKSLICFYYTLQKALEIKDIVGVTFMLSSLANCFLAMTELEKTQLCIEQGIRLATIIDSPYDLCDLLQTKTMWLIKNQQLSAAYETNNQCHSIVQKYGFAEFSIKIQCLSFMLSYWLQIETWQEIEKQSNNLLQIVDENDLENKALIWYTLWKINPSYTFAQESALELYRTLYQKTPKLEFWNKYYELSGEKLTITSVFPPIPEIVLRNPPNIPALFKQVDALIEEIARENA